MKKVHCNRGVSVVLAGCRHDPETQGTVLHLHPDGAAAGQKAASPER